MGVTRLIDRFDHTDRHTAKNQRRRQQGAGMRTGQAVQFLEMPPVIRRVLHHQRFAMTERPARRAAFERHLHCAQEFALVQGRGYKGQQVGG